MSDSEIIAYFDNNLEQIFSSETNRMVSFLNNCIKEPGVRQALIDWPEEVKLAVVKKYFSI